MEIEKESIDYTSVNLLNSKNHTGVLLTFYNLCYKPKSKKKCVDNILKNVCGQFKSGKMSAILGPSGAGKTTLLNVLSGFKDNGTNGTILINGEQRNINEFRKISSYIPQEFPVLDQLTVLETLRISADLKLDSKTKCSFKQNVINDILKLLNLEKSKTKLISKLSGGERKRLSIGVELVTNPPILFLDEPTSGLDSVSSFQILLHLKKLACDGRTVICVIHQPSSRLLELFDSILVLSEGECIYNGPLDEMVKSFSLAGFHCPNYYNRADYAIEVASHEHGKDLTKLIVQNNKKFTKFNGFTIADNEDVEKEIILNGKDHSVCKNQTKKCNKIVTKENKYPVNYFRQFTILTKRSLISMSRDLMCVQLRILCHALVAILLGVVFWNIGSDLSKILSNSSCMFFFVLFLFFANSMPTVLSCPLETAVLLREHLNNWYSVEAYYFAKFLSDLPLQFLCPTLFCTIAYYMTGQSNDFGRFLMFWGVGLLTSILGQSIGLLAGSACNMQLAVFLVPASCIPMLIFSGFFIRTSELSECLRPLIKISYFRYSLEGFIQSIYGYNRTDVICNEILCQFHSIKSYLKWNNMTDDRYGFDITILLIWIVFIQLLLYISLKIKVKNSL